MVSDMRLRPEETPTTNWQAWSIVDLVSRLLRLAGDPDGRPPIIAIDGRGASGKSTLATAIAEQLPGSAIAHTDDLAWHEPFFDWGHLLEQVLATIHRGDPVDFQPPAWPQHGRGGSIVVPAGTSAVIVEGTGALQRDLAHLVDASIWVQSDWELAEHRGLERDIASGVNGDREQATRFWHDWMRHEVGFLAEHEPWALADLTVAGTEAVPLQAGEWAVCPTTT